MMHSKLALARTCLMFAAMTACLGGLAAAPSSDAENVDRRWLDRLDAADRNPINALIGYAPPAFSDELKWHNVDEPASWQALRDRVVVIQSWATGSELGRRSLTQAVEAISPFADSDVQLIALHIPEGAENVATFLERRPIEVPVVVDSSGEFCDKLGVFRRPVNLVIDRNGAVRYAGLTAAGIRAAVSKLIDEPLDPDVCPEPRPEAASKADFPPITGSVRSAMDVRGQEAPAFHVQKWINGQPDMNGKVVVLDFWATWCGPCIASIPKLNGWAERFGDDLVIVGVSNEADSAFVSGMAKRKLDPATFKYALALDSEARMQRAIGIRGIPHVTVMCSDWIVRWQGHPGSLTDTMLEQIIEANGGSGGEIRGRWASR